jgi:RHS repeat-associated protein
MGNVTLDNLPNNYRFDAENHLVGQSPGSFSFMYDGDGERVRKSNGSVTTLFWRDPAGKVLTETDGSGNPQQDYIYLNGVMIARSDVTHGHPRLDYYYIHDHLGSTRMITNPAGAVCYDADYFPYGSEQATPTNNCAQNYKFTGKERDPDLGMDDFGARWYLPTLARFLTPDWSGQPAAVPYAALTDPQTLNLYSYVRNNPLAKVDPDGHGLLDWALRKLKGPEPAPPPAPPPPPGPRMAGGNPITNQTFFTRNPKGQTGNERPGVGGAGNFGACRGQGCSRPHYGEDVSGPVGADIHASTSGTVTFSGLSGSETTGYGNTIKVDDGSGTTTVYSHNEANGVSVGDMVERGDVIGTVGQTGNASELPSSESHVHFEVQIDGQRVDPAVWLNSVVAPQ